MTRSLVTIQSIKFHTTNNTELAGIVFKPDSDIRSAVLIAGGLCIPQRFYKAFATWLAQRGHLVMTFDVQGVGLSRSHKNKQSLRHLDANMLTWAREDFPAAVDTLLNTVNGRRITLIGHSLGAHHAAMTHSETQARINNLISVAAGSGYWRDWATPSRVRAPLMLHIAAPMLIPLFGYFPGKSLGMVGDIPGPAMRQWIKWCRHPEFAWGADPEQVMPNLRSATFRIKAFSFTDDEAMTEQCTRKLLNATPNAPSTLVLVNPLDVGMTNIGHTGAFRQHAEHRLWEMFESEVDVLE